MSDNLCFQRGGPALFHTEQLARQSAMLLHGVGLNIGGFAPLNKAYIAELRALAARFEASVISDHLAFTRSLDLASYELLPLPRRNDYLPHLLARIDEVQCLLGRQLSLENTSAYIDFATAEMSEAEFIKTVVQRSGCGLLLDLNNLYVNAVNFGTDVHASFAGLPWEAVTQIHVAGHRDFGDYLFDTHDQPASSQVLNLLAQFMRLEHEFDRLPQAPIILEWDDPQASLSTVLSERERILAYLATTQSSEAAHA